VHAFVVNFLQQSDIDSLVLLGNGHALRHGQQTNEQGRDALSQVVNALLDGGSSFAGFLTRQL